MELYSDRPVRAVEALVKGVVEMVPTFETAFARVRAYAVFECHKGLWYHRID